MPWTVFIWCPANLSIFYIILFYLKKQTNKQTPQAVQGFQQAMHGQVQAFGQHLELFVAQQTRELSGLRSTIATYVEQKNGELMQALAGLGAIQVRN